MDESSAKKRKRGNLLWLLVLLAVAFAWWFTRSTPTTGVSAAEEAADRLAATAALDVDDILVDLRDSVSDADVADLERSLGIDLRLVSDESLDERFYRAHVRADRQADLLRALNAHGDVEIAEADSYMHIPVGETHLRFAPTAEDQRRGFPNDPLYSKQWHMKQINMPAAWKLADGEGVIVAVLDTGVAYENFKKFHIVPDLVGVEFVKPYNFVRNNKHANDDHGHGTHVTGTIAQATHNGIGVTGVARKVKIMPLKVLSGSGSGSVGGIADAIRYAADNGAKVINMSLGGPFPSRVMKKAVKYAYSKGVIVVCAAGNESGKVGYPAAYPGAFAVAATQPDEGTAFYSNYGKQVDIAAPGGNTRHFGADGGVLQNTIVLGNPEKNEYASYNGTSMASPHVAGVAALVVGEGITEPAAVERILLDTARAPKSGNFDKLRYGAGIVDAEAAVLKARTHAGGWQLLIGLLLAGAVAGSLRRRGLLASTLGGGYLAGVVVGASGLFFLPHIAPTVSSFVGVEALTRGLPSLDLAVLGPLGHGNALFFSALLPLLMIVVLYGSARLRPLLAGLSVGVAGHLLFHAAAGFTDVHWVPNTLMLDELWLALNAFACIAMARLVLRR